MEPAVRALHNDALVAEIAEAVGVAPGELRSLGGFESFVYETTVAGAPRIVKATWHKRRTPDEIGAEIHFVNFLADGGAPVCGAVPLAGGMMVRTVPASTGAFHVYAFEKAPGAVRKPKDATDKQWIRWGALVGQMHRLSSSYEGPPPPLSRPTWQDEYASIERLVADDPVFLGRLRDTLGALRALPRDAGAFGASHTDLHSHNIFWHNTLGQQSEPRVFDFDDMLEFWFISDLAIVFYYALLSPVWHDDDRQADFERMRELVMRGYETEHSLPESSHDALPLFLSLREQTLRAVILRSIPEEERGERWQTFLADASERIAKKRPALDLSA